VVIIMTAPRRVKERPPLFRGSAEPRDCLADARLRGVFTEAEPPDGGHIAVRRFGECALARGSTARS
jgi:hypothetical protein